MLFAGIFFAAMLAAVLTGELPPLALVVYAAASAVTFAAYALDKSAAQKGQWRTKESTLHLFGIAGGWPGALIAQRVLRHKSKKQPFQTVFWMTVVLNCGVLLVCLIPGFSRVALSFFGGIA